MNSHHPSLTPLPITAVARALTRAVERVLEGPHPWGYVDAAPTGRVPQDRMRLTVYPPGTNHSERRALQFYRNWPIAGAAIALVIMSTLHELPPTAGFTIAMSTYVAGLATGFMVTRRMLPFVRRLTVMVVEVGGRYETLGDVDGFHRATDQLRVLDKRKAGNLISAASYEAGWAEVYEGIQPVSGNTCGATTPDGHPCP